MTFTRHGRALVLAWLATAALAGPCAAAGPERETTLTIDFEGDWQVDDQPGRQTVNLARALARPSAAPVRGRGAALAPAQVQYEGGADTQREAKVIEEPGNPHNHVLAFVLREPNVPVKGRPGAKGRVQMNLYSNRNVHELHQSVRLRLAEGFDAVSDYPGTFGWLTLSEWWNDPGWLSSPHPFRISVNLAKREAGPRQTLYFGVSASVPEPSKPENWDRHLWQVRNADFAVPVGRWMRVDYYFRDGLAGEGRFVMTVTPEGGSRHVIADVTGPTRHPDAARSDGLTHFNPVKLYTSRQLVDHVRRSGSALVTYWDDLVVQACAQADAGAPPSPCAAQLERMLR